MGCWSKQIATSLKILTEVILSRLHPAVGMEFYCYAFND